MFYRGGLNYYIIFYIVALNMNRESWATIVKKPVTLQATLQVVAQPGQVVAQPGKGPSSVEDDEPLEILPTDIYVPEPPRPKNKLVVSDNVLDSAYFNNEILKIQEIKISLEKEIQLKMEKFHSSYAFTKYTQDMNILYNQKSALEKREVIVKQQLLLRDNLFAKRALEIVKRIKNYLGPKDEYLRKYTTFNNELNIYCKITQTLLFNFYSLDNTGIEWEISESIEKEYDWPNKIEFKFTVQSDKMIPILEAAIKTEISEYITIYK